MHHHAKFQAIPSMLSLGNSWKLKIGHCWWYGPTDRCTGGKRVFKAWDGWRDRQTTWKHNASGARGRRHKKVLFKADWYLMCPTNICSICLMFGLYFKVNCVGWLKIWVNILQHFIYISPQNFTLQTVLVTIYDLNSTNIDCPVALGCWCCNKPSHGLWGPWQFYGAFSYIFKIIWIYNLPRYSTCWCTF